MQILIQTAGLFTYRLGATIIYNFFSITKLEMFPTQIRPTASQVTAFGSMFSYVVIPWIQGWFESMELSVIYTFAISSIFSVVGTYFIPETYGLDPPEMIKELEY